MAGCAGSSRTVEKVPAPWLLKAPPTSLMYASEFWNAADAECRTTSPPPFSRKPSRAASCESDIVGWLL